MTVNLEQFLQLFFEECSENLDVLEQGLLSIGNASANEDTVNQIFRAAHSIKGGAATSGQHRALVSKHRRNRHRE